MIEFLKTGNYGLLQHCIVVMWVMWVIMVLAVAVDLWAGVDSAKARGEKIYSGGLRRTFSKLGDYWRIQVIIRMSLGSRQLCFIPKRVASLKLHVCFLHNSILKSVQFDLPIINC